MSDLRKQRSANRDLKVPCHICGVLEPLLTAHDHHRELRAFGGTDNQENRVWLCASCHTRLHRVQEFLVQGKTASAYDLCAALFANNSKARGELWALANEAATSESEAKGAFDLHREHAVVKLNVDTETWAVIKGMAKDRKIPASKLAAELLRNAVRQA